MAGRWLGVVGLPADVGRAAWQTAGFAVPLVRSWWLFPAAIGAGVLPLLLGYALGVSWHQLTSALLLSPLLLSAVREDATARGVGAVMLAFFAHAAVAITLSANDPVGAAAIMPDGADYWAKQQVWIHTGEDPEYVVANWAPAHLQLFFAVILFSYLSLGVAPLFRGFYEVDLMNYYVGRMLAEGDGHPASLLVGWHPWSALRGVCYAVLVFEVVSLSLAALTGRSLSTTRRRQVRWGGAVGFFLADCLVKYVTLEPVRSTLHGHLP